MQGGQRKDDGGEEMLGERCGHSCGAMRCKWVCGSHILAWMTVTWNSMGLNSKSLKSPPDRTFVMSVPSSASQVIRAKPSTTLSVSRVDVRSDLCTLKCRVSATTHISRLHLIHIAVSRD